jgi:hypothetical protein
LSYRDLEIKMKFSQMCKTNSKMNNGTGKDTQIISSSYVLFLVTIKVKGLTPSKQMSFY